MIYAGAAVSADSQHGFEVISSATVLGLVCQVPFNDWGRQARFLGADSTAIHVHGS